ncbi:hypothetical protein [Endozoicomonas ascidiicola]|uniref:hypothetical protein n=1 Tax=Endozoicomonas ascidiicola TaxID=1698521 RepID=UPI0008370E3D|nr:hypothetical protein [Endozoicomonas ascidiicola]
MNASSPLPLTISQNVDSQAFFDTKIPLNKPADRKGNPHSGNANAKQIPLPACFDTSKPLKVPTDTGKSNHQGRAVSKPAANQIALINPTPPADVNAPQKKSLFQRYISYPGKVAFHYARILSDVVTTATACTVGAIIAFAGRTVSTLATAPVSLLIKLGECCGLVKAGTAGKVFDTARHYGMTAGLHLGYATGKLAGRLISLPASPIPLIIGFAFGANDSTHNNFNRIENNQAGLTTFLKKLAQDILENPEGAFTDSQMQALKAVQDRNNIQFIDLSDALFSV